MELAAICGRTGAGGSWADDVEDEACRDDSVPVWRRSSGGGTVVLGPGCLLFTLVLPYVHHPALKELRSSYRYILTEVAEALRDIAPDIEQAGISDLVWEGRKFSGNSQQRKRSHLLHHGTLLHNCDLTRIARYLKQPPRQPAYREGRAHVEFLRNLPATEEMLIERLRLRWQALTKLTDWPRELLANSWRRSLARRSGRGVVKPAGTRPR